MTSTTSFIVTDIEADGPDPGRHSMLSIGSVACGADGARQGEFTINLAPLPDGEQDPGTMAWWKTQPEAWHETTRNQVEPGKAIRAWADWVRSLPGTPVFVAHPLSFDGAWIDWYLQRYVGRRLFFRSREPGFCHGSGVDLPSLVMAITGWEYERCAREHYPAAWFGGHDHSHCALDDARGYAHLFSLIVSRRILEIR